MLDSNLRQSQQAVVQRMIAGHRSSYTSGQNTKYNTNRLQEKYQARERRLVRKLETVGAMIDKMAENEEGSIVAAEFIVDQAGSIARRTEDAGPGAPQRRRRREEQT
jgi:hypothetical protein